MEDRFSQIGIKHMAELTHTNMPTPENFTNPWSEFMTCYEPYTIIYLESWTVKHFLKHILPKLTVPVILITGDGDTSNPEIDIQKYRQYLPEPGTKNPVIAHWFAQHCRPDAAKHKWITCIPLGINQWLQTREKFQLYAQTYGHLMNPMEGGAPAWKPQENSVLVSFGITKKKAFRKPVWDYYCGDGFKSTGGSASCFFKAVDKDYTFFDVFDAIRNARFVVSPPGEAIDCYRTYEALLLGSYPIVKTSVLDPIFEDLPVLIVKDLTKVTAKLLEDTYNDFRRRTWKFEKLYHSYWQNLIWKKRVELGGPSHFIKYHSKLELPHVPIPKPNSFIPGTCASKTKHYYPTTIPKPKDLAYTDRISQIGMKRLGELTYRNMPSPEEFDNALDDFLDCLHPYTTIYVDAWRTLDFAEKILPNLKVPVIVISGDGDSSNPYFGIRTFLKSLPGKPKRPPMIAHWFAQHCRPDAAEWDWITCIPLGVNQWIKARQNVHEYAQTYGHVMNRVEGGIPEWKPFENSVLVNFRNKTNSVEREKAWSYFCGEEFVKNGGSAHCFYKRVSTDFTFRDIFDIIRKARFVVSPPGAAIDCYRTYEALLLGSYPIVKTSQLDPIFVDLPVLIVDDFTHVTGQLLEETYHKFRSRDWNFEKLYHTYWQTVIWNKRVELGGPEFRLEYKK
ncbi:hypothetical protein HK103_007249 [Boothiomyces macroporosus]|uniref:Exostosin GT47 domain-containing protein n=1 Tax=Boothiomyces macroporosus TaxID=261099 RepID=A0AAD5UCT2_9FUNG|nr:hypothetical protein HK103_007249 [Boothiomyces macroporosus]